MDLGLFNVSDTYKYVLNQSGANAITLGNGNSVNWNAGGVVALIGNQSINGEKYFNNTISAPNIYINNPSSDSSLEIGGAGAVYIDLKKPNSDDFDLRITTDGSAGILNTKTGPLIFQTNDGSARLNITQAGKVGIGDSNPASKLNVNGEITSNILSDGGGNVRMIGGSYGAYFRIDGDNFWLLSTAVNNQYGVWNSYRPFTYNLTNGTVTIGGSDSVFGLVVGTNGNAGIGGSDRLSKLHLKGSVNSWTDGILLEQVGTSGKKYAISSRENGKFSISDETGLAERLIISSAGNVGLGRSPLTNKLEVEGTVASKTSGTTWATNSDKRIKKAINTITDALEKICKVRLVKFKYTDEYKKDHPSIEDIEYLNVIAQEFAEVFPNDVKESGEKMPDGSPILQVDIHPLTIYSAAAIQELKQIIDSQNLRISELESKLL